MRTYDFSPLFRSTVGFDRLFDLAETAQRATDEGYPPYNIERLAEDRYQITLAVAGFSPDEVAITAEQNVVTVEGAKTEKAEREFLYRGISTRHFKRQFSLADYVQVKAATFDNGLLKIELVREIPEAMSRGGSPSMALRPATYISSKAKPRRFNFERNKHSRPRPGRECTLLSYRAKTPAVSKRRRTSDDRTCRQHC